MRKWLILLLALLLACPALAEDASPFYLLVAEDGTPVGTAALCQDASTLLAAAHLAEQGTLMAQGAGGTMAITQVRPMGSDLALLTLASPSPAEPLALNLEGTPVAVLGYDEKGAPCYSTLEQRAIIPYGEDYALTFTAQVPMLPGGILLDNEASLCGLCVASYGEGVNRYVGIAGQLLQAVKHNATWVAGFTAVPGAGEIDVDWSACDMACSQEDCLNVLFVEDVANPYYSYYTTEGTSRATLLVPPGRSYRLWLQHAHGEPATGMAMPESLAQAVELPAPEAFDRYAFTNADMYLSAVPAARAESAANTRQPPMPAITAQALLEPDSAIFLQVRSAYQVEEEQTALLVTSLVSPEGYCFTLEGSFLFSPSLQEQDDWNVDITGLFTSYTTYCGELPGGEYTLSFYLNGALGGSMTFTLE